MKLNFPSTHDPSLQMVLSKYVYYKYFCCVTAMDTRRPFCPHINVDQENNRRELISTADNVLVAPPALTAPVC